jgi:triacylglycerol lipase
MVPVSLFLFLLLEISSYTALAHFWLDASWQTAGFAALGALLGVRAGIVTVTWVFSSVYASPAPKLTFGQRLRMMFDEYLAFLFSFVVLMPFEWLWMPADRLRPCKTPILLVHGYGCSRGIWWKMRRELEAAGHTVATVSLTPPYTSVGKLVPQLVQRIDEVCAACDAQQVILIAHSMGGLVCRSYLSRHGIAQVERLITFASPHRGSELARLGFGQNAREMEPGSLWLNDLAYESVKVPFFSIRTSHDNYVMPQVNQRMPEAEDIELSALGHLAALYSPRTTKAILACISKLKKG